MSVRRSIPVLALVAVMAPAHAANLTGLSERARILAPAVSYGTWPRAPERYGMPTPERSVLPEGVADLAAVRGCRAVVLEGEPWPECAWSWTTPRDAAGRTSWLELTATLTPDAEAASAYLLARLADSTLPTAELVEQYRTADRPGSLGSVSFKIEREAGRETVVRLQRGNLVLSVRGHGELRAAALPAAFSLDRWVVEGDEVSPADLRGAARRLLAEGAQGLVGAMDE